MAGLRMLYEKKAMVLKCASVPVRHQLESVCALCLVQCSSQMDEQSPCEGVRSKRHSGGWGSSFPFTSFLPPHSLQVHSASLEVPFGSNKQKL